MRLTNRELHAIKAALDHCEAAQGELEYMEGPGVDKDEAIRALFDARRKVTIEIDRRISRAHQKLMALYMEEP